MTMLLRGRRAAEALALAPAPLLLEAPLFGGGGGLRRHPPPLDPQRLAQRRDEPLDGQLAVPPLAPLVLRDRAENRAGTRDDSPLLRGSERRRALDVEDRF